MQEFAWISADSAATESFPEASTVPLKAISSSLVKVNTFSIPTC